MDIWNQTILLKKDFNFRGVIGIAEQKDFVSLSHEINDERKPRYSEKEIIAGRYIPFKTGESVVACNLTRVRKPNQSLGKRKGASRDFRKKKPFRTVGRSDRKELQE